MGLVPDLSHRLHGDGLALDTKKALLWSDKIPVRVIGLDDMVVVAARSHVEKVGAIAAGFAASPARSDGALF